MGIVAQDFIWALYLDNSWV